MKQRMSHFGNRNFGELSVSFESQEIEDLTQKYDDLVNQLSVAELNIKVIQDEINRINNANYPINLHDINYRGYKRKGDKLLRTDSGRLDNNIKKYIFPYLNKGPATFKNTDSSVNSAIITYPPELVEEQKLRYEAAKKSNINSTMKVLDHKGKYLAGAFNYYWNVGLKNDVQGYLKSKSKIPELNEQLKVEQNKFVEIKKEQEKIKNQLQYVKDKILEKVLAEKSTYSTPDIINDELDEIIITKPIEEIFEPEMAEQKEAIEVVENEKLDQTSASTTPQVIVEDSSSNQLDILTSITSPPLTVNKDVVDVAENGKLEFPLDTTPAQLIVKLPSETNEKNEAPQEAPKKSKVGLAVGAGVIGLLTYMMSKGE